MKRLQFAGRLRHQQADLPVPGVEAESNGFSIVGAQAAVRAQNQELGVEQAFRFPTHARVLAQAEEIPGWLRKQHFRRKRQ